MAIDTIGKPPTAELQKSLALGFAKFTAEIDMLVPKGTARNQGKLRLQEAFFWFENALLQEQAQADLTKAVLESAPTGNQPR